MNFKKNFFSVVITFILLSIILSSCKQTSQNITLHPQDSFSFIDDAQNKITLDKNALPERIIVFNPADAEIFYALGAQDNIVALGEFCNFPKETSAKTKISTGTKTNLEEILALKPDCVIMAMMAQDVSIYQTLINSNITVITSNATDIASTYKNIEQIGALTNKKELAQTLISNIKKDFFEIQEKTKTLTPKKAYFEISPLQLGLWTSGKNTFQNEILKAAGFINVFENVEGWKEISQESVLEKNPEIIITTVSSKEGIADPVTEIINRKGWETLLAVQNNSVYTIDPDIVSRGGPRIAQGAKKLFELAYADEK